MTKRQRKQLVKKVKKQARANVGLPIALFLVLFFYWRTIPDDDLAWAVFVFAIFPAMALNLMVLALGLTWRKEQNLFSKFCLLLGFLFFLQFVLPLEPIRTAFALN